MSKKYILDACSVIAYFLKEDGADIVKNLIGDAIDNKTELSMHKLNLYEVYYDTWKSQGEETAVNMYNTFMKLPISIVDSISDEMMAEAARFKTKHNVSVADSFALATARLEGAALITSDHHEFDPVDKKGDIDFLWIR